MRQYTAGQPLECPHCGESLFDPVEDFVVQGPHGRLNHPYDEVCDNCEETFFVTKTGPDSYTVTKDE